jgi:phage protein D
MSDLVPYLSEQYNNYLAPEAVIWINGQKLSEDGFFFTTLEIDRALDGADTCTFSIADAIDLEFQPKKAGLFELGDTLEVHIGYADSHQKKSDLSILFKGIITAINWNFSEGEYLDISVEGKDYSFLMMKHAYKKVIKDVTASEIVKKIVSEIYSNLFKEENRKITATDVKYNQMENQKENDYLFIADLAKQYGYEFFVDNDLLYFRPVPKEQSSSLSLRYGQEILGFKPELNVEKEVSKVKVIGLELAGNKEAIVGEATADEAVFSDTGEGIKALLKKLNRIEYEVREPVKSKEEATKRAEAIMANFSQNSFKAEIRSVGIPDLKPGITISLIGLGDKFSCDYYIEKSVHTFSESGYESVLHVRGKSKG